MNNEVWAVTMVADEEDIIGYNILHLLVQGFDKVVVADNLSADRTPAILFHLQKAFPDKIEVQLDDDPAYYQSFKMTKLAQYAYEQGARWVVPFDADELLYSMNKDHTVAELLRQANANVVGIPMWNHFCTPKDKESVNPFKRMLYRHPEQNPLDKIAMVWEPGMVIDMGNHNVRIGRSALCLPGIAIGIGIRHFPYRSAAHFIHKAERGGKAYELATGLPATAGAHWRQYYTDLKNKGAEALISHYEAHFTYADPDIQLKYDPAPYSGEINEQLCGYCAE